MASGFILLILLACGAAYAFTRLRGKMKLPVTPKHWQSVIIIFVLVVVLFYVTRSGGQHH